MDQTHMIITLNNFYFVSYNVDPCVEFDTAFQGGLSQGSEDTFKLKNYKNISTWQECGKYLICIS